MNSKGNYVHIDSSSIIDMLKQKGFKEKGYSVPSFTVMEYNQHLVTLTICMDLRVQVQVLEVRVNQLNPAYYYNVKDCLKELPPIIDKVISQ